MLAAATVHDDRAVATTLPLPPEDLGQQQHVEGTVAPSDRLAQLISLQSPTGRQALELPLQTSGARDLACDTHVDRLLLTRRIRPKPILARASSALTSLLS
jgi:hypothetical protein